MWLGVHRYGNWAMYVPSWSDLTQSTFFYNSDNHYCIIDLPVSSSLWNKKVQTDWFVWLLRRLKH